MSKGKAKQKISGFERNALIVCVILFVAIFSAAWLYAMKIQEGLLARGTKSTHGNVQALIEVEKMRNQVESQISNSRAYFILGSKSLYDAQKKDKQDFLDALTSFQKNYNLEKIPEIADKIVKLEDQQQEIFDQGIKFREQMTESRIVGQFYNSKVVPVLKNINKALDDIVEIHNAQLEKERAEAKDSAKEAEVQIPEGMKWLTVMASIVFLAIVMLVIRMIFERKRQVAERTRLYEEAQKAVQSRDELIVAISQDLKEPLKAITDVAESLREKKETGEVQESADFIKSTVDVAETQIKDILDQAKSEEGSMTLRLEQQGIDGILEEARLMMLPLAKQKEIKIQVDTVNPPALAFYDHERVMRVLANLMGNAIKFGPKGSKVTVKVKSDQAFVFITVIDEGPGIPEGQRAGLFDNFWQARKTADQGAGVGLAIVKTIVDAHGGTVSVDSHVGHGSKFTFSLPRRRPAGVQLGRKAVANGKATSRPAMQADL